MNLPTALLLLASLVISGLSANAQSALGLFGHRQSLQVIAHSKPSMLHPNDNMKHFGWGTDRSLLAWTCSYELLFAAAIDEQTEIGISGLFNLNYHLTDSTQGALSAIGMQYRHYLAQLGNIAPLGLYAVAHSRYLHTDAQIEGSTSIKLPYLQVGAGIGCNKAIAFNENLLLGAQLNTLTQIPLYFSPDTPKSDLLRSQVTRRLRQAYTLDFAFTLSYYF